MGHKSPQIDSNLIILCLNRETCKSPYQLRFLIETSKNYFNILLPVMIILYYFEVAMDYWEISYFK